MSAFDNPTSSDFRSYFARDFPYGSTQASVMDQDIVTALTDAETYVNTNLFPNQGQYTIGILLLAGHFLVMNLRASSQGIQGSYPWLTSNKSVGSVAEGFTIPDRILENPEFAMLSKTYYGSKFLFLILPQLSGQIFSVCGATNP